MASLGKLLSESGLDRQCIIDGARTLSYRELDHKSSSLALHFQRIGVGKGDRIAIYLPNCWQLVAAIFAAFKIGAIAVPMDFRSSKDEVEYILKDAAPSAVVSSTEKEIPSEQDMSQVSIETSTERELTVEENESEFEYPKDIEETDPAMILYTSGTTGAAKGVVLTHRSISAVLRGLSVAWNLERGREVFVAVLPMTHSGGLNCNVCSMIFNSGTVVVMRKFNAAELLDLIEKYRVTGFAAVPTVYNALVQEKDLGSRSLSSLRICLSSGAPLSDSTFRDFQKKTGIIIEQGWGLTEASPQLTLCPIGAYETNYVGVPILGTEIAAMDDNLSPLPNGSIGQLAARGAQIMKGYWRNEIETKKIMIDGGWLLTGDMGYTSEKGVYVLGRKKDTINSGGYKVWPGEIEKVLMEHSLVKEAAVVGVPDSYYGEAVKAFVVTNGPVDEGELQAFCKQHLSSYKVPKFVEFRDALPKSAVGKILKRELVKT